MKYRLLLLTILFCKIINAQRVVVTDSTTRTFYYGVGYQYQSFHHLADRIGLYPAYEKPGASFVSAILGFSRQTDRFVNEINTHFAIGSKGDDEKKSSQLMNAGLEINLGYCVVDNRKLRLYPLVGVAIEGYMANFNRDVSTVSFDSVLLSNNVQQRIEPIHFSNMFFCYHGGLALDVTQKRGKFLMGVGLRLGYTGSFKSRTWRVNDNQTVANAPSDRIGQFNASVVLSYGRKTGSRM